ncbi:hypothetical protein ACQI4E_03475 [Streptomyces sp. CA-252508]|uniref:hypothetical protein n=1 Tax=Streptomyces sp. CA-252508 TaxID=3418946 RepID=UPI003D8FCC97
MSRNTDFVFTLERAAAVSDVLGALGAAGWVPDDMGEINYLIDVDQGDRQQRSLDDFADVVADLERGVAAGQICSIMLTWQETQTGGSFFFYPSGDRLMLSPILNTKTRLDHPEFLDLEWYLSRLLGPLETVGLTGVETTDLA